MTRAILLLAACLHPWPAAAQTATDRDQILTVVQQFFDGMAARDVEMSRRALLPDGRFYSTREDAGKVMVRTQSHEEYLASLGKGEAAPLERMWNPEIRLRGSIAIVWTPYDFHRDGKFSHCGVDAFTLVRTPDGWRIAGVAYTIEPTGCDPSPLGPPKTGAR